MVAQHAVLDHFARAHPLEAVVQGDPGARDGRRARAAVGLDHVAVDGDLALTEPGQVHHRAQRAPDQALDLLRAARGVAHGRLAPGAVRCGARQHAVLGRHPASALALEPWRQPLLEARRAVHVRVAELDQARAFRVHGHGPIDGDRTKLVGIAFGEAHASRFLLPLRMRDTMRAPPGPATAKSRGARLTAYCLGLKEMVARGAVIAAARHAAALETGAPSRMGTDRCGRASRTARRRHAPRGRRASPESRRGTTGGACSRPQKQGMSSKLRVFLTMARLHLHSRSSVQSPGGRRI